jgi:hypothetical protein
MPSREIRNSVLIGSHTPVIEQQHGKLWFVLCGDNDFIGYWDEDNFSDDMGWEADEISRVLNMKKGDTFQNFSSSMHLIICVKE